MCCHLGISGLALQALQKMLHKESKNLPAVEMQPQKMSKADFSLMFWVKQGHNQISENMCVVSKDHLIAWLCA